LALAESGYIDLHGPHPLCSKVVPAGSFSVFSTISMLSSLFVYVRLILFLV
jgi:hypothetical protein